MYLVLVLVLLFLSFLYFYFFWSTLGVFIFVGTNLVRFRGDRAIRSALGAEVEARKPENNLEQGCFCQMARSCQVICLPGLFTPWHRVTCANWHGLPVIFLVDSYPIFATCIMVCLCQLTRSCYVTPATRPITLPLSNSPIDTPFS